MQIALLFLTLIGLSIKSEGPLRRVITIGSDQTVILLQSAEYLEVRCYASGDLAHFSNHHITAIGVGDSCFFEDEDSFASWTFSYDSKNIYYTLYAGPKAGVPDGEWSEPSTDQQGMTCTTITVEDEIKAESCYGYY